MAKRTRGSARPGQRPADKRAAGRPQPRPASRPASALSDSEEARAAELEARIVAQERDAEAARSRSHGRSRSSEMERTAAPRGTGLLAAKAAEEYEYVARDVKRIVTVAAGLALILAVLFVLVDVAHVIQVG